MKLHNGFKPPIKNLLSIVITHYATNENRSYWFVLSMESLLRTTKKHPCQIILVDNGGPHHTNDHINRLVYGGFVQVYVKNHQNLSYGMGRNQGISLAVGEYICIADDDIEYKNHWLEACMKPLLKYPDKKWYSTPIDYPSNKYQMGDFDIDGETYKINDRAGSNCFIIARDKLDDMGEFPSHRISGPLWTDKAVRAGYKAIVTPQNMVKDLGLRKGVNFKKPFAVSTTLTDGTEIYFNEDEYVRS